MTKPRTIEERTLAAFNASNEIISIVTRYQDDPGIAMLALAASVGRLMVITGLALEDFVEDVRTNMACGANDDVRQPAEPAKAGAN
jgi:hypothetical protein